MVVVRGSNVGKDFFWLVGVGVVVVERFSGGGDVWVGFLRGWGCEMRVLN